MPDPARLASDLLASVDELVAAAGLAPPAAAPAARLKAAAAAPHGDSALPSPSRRDALRRRRTQRRSAG